MVAAAVAVVARVPQGAQGQGSGQVQGKGQGRGRRAKDLPCLVLDLPCSATVAAWADRGTFGQGAAGR